jgi:formylglycine-generating enzyme required for sulfatase activity
MGSNAVEQQQANSSDTIKNRTDRENPQHLVSVNAFAMGKFEVTRIQFAAFVKATGHNMGNSCKVYADGKWPDTPDRNWRNPGYGQTDNDPVVCVNWDDAQAYARWLSAKTGRSYRLPTEAEWEYACRAGANQTYCGSDNVDSVAWYGAFATPVGSSTKSSNPVGRKQANAWGLFDMSGNAWEWVQDCWNENYRLAPNDGSAWASGNCERHMLRGGAWSNIPALNRAAFRGSEVTSVRFGVYGFRLARALP